MAGIYNFTVEQFATFVTSLTVKDSEGNVRDLSDYMAKMQVRFKHKAGPLIFTLIESDGITISPSNIIEITISADRTGMLKDDSFYDIVIMKDDTVERILEGQLLISEGVTR